MLKEITTPYRLSQFLIYCIIIGITIISLPTNPTTYLLVRFVQAIEMLIFTLLFVPRVQVVLNINKFNMLVNFWWLFYIVNTLLHPNNVGITPIFTWLNIALLLLLGTKYWTENPYGSLKALITIFSFLVYLNAILIIMFPEGLWVDPEWIGRGSAIRYLFGNQNQTGLVCLFAVTTQSIYTFAYKKGQFNLFLLIIVSLTCILFLGSMTSTIGICLITLYIIFNRMFKRPKLIVIIFAVIYLIVFVLLIWYGNTIEEIKWATAFIENTLNKDTTFSKRTIIWENAIALIKSNPIVGYGIQNVEWNDTFLEGSGTHNLWVMLLLNSGFVGCFSFICILIYAIHKALSIENKITITAVMSLCVLLIMSFFEAYNILYIFFFLQIVYYSPHFLLNQEAEAKIEPHL